MKRKLYSNFKKLEEILSTINPRTVKELKIKLSSSCSSDMPFFASVFVGSTEYEVLLGDMDDRYWNDGISYFFDIIRKSGLNYTCEPYIQQTCSGYRTWTV